MDMLLVVLFFAAWCGIVMYDDVKYQFYKWKTMYLQWKAKKEIKKLNRNNIETR